jgi:hypothetical protein
MSNNAPDYETGDHAVHPLSNQTEGPTPDTPWSSCWDFSPGTD